jgi:hypothetical protein
MFFNSVLLNTMMYSYWRDQCNSLGSLLDTNVCIQYLYLLNYLILTISYIHMADQRMVTKFVPRRV